jgi:predicted CopG family antitoxin
MNNRVKTIKVSEETYEKLKKMKIIKEESFDSVIKRIIEKYEMYVPDA